MPKYSDYKEWEDYRDKLIEERYRLSKLGISTYVDIPLTPPEGIYEWMENRKCKSK